MIYINQSIRSDGGASMGKLLLPVYADADGDGVPAEEDCDDFNPFASPDAVEVCDGMDNTCDGLVDPQFTDTDSDGVADCMDPDDDGDGILTRNEDTNANLDPTDDVTDPAVGPDFLNPDVAIETIVEAYRSHTFTLTTSVTVTLLDLVLTNGSEELIRESLFLGTIDNAFNATFLVEPVFTND